MLQTKKDNEEINIPCAAQEPLVVVRVTSHIPDKGQVMVRYYGLC